MSAGERTCGCRPDEREFCPDCEPIAEDSQIASAPEDRALARAVVSSYFDDENSWSSAPLGIGDAIAEAIAAERERVLAPIQALAEEWEAKAADKDRHITERTVARVIAEQFRAVLPPTSTDST